MKGDFLPLQTSLTSPNFPARQPPFRSAKFFSVLKTAVAAQGSFWVDWEVRELCRVRLRTRLVSGMRRVVYAFRKCRLIPPHQSLTRQLPPKGKPFCKPSFALHNKATGRKHEVLFATYLFVIYSLLCMYGVKKASPWGEAVAQATDEGG